MVVVKGTVKGIVMEIAIIVVKGTVKGTVKETAKAVVMAHAEEAVAIQVLFN